MRREVQDGMANWELAPHVWGYGQVLVGIVVRDCHAVAGVSSMPDGSTAASASEGYVQVVFV